MTDSLAQALEGTERKRWVRIDAVRDGLSESDAATFDAALRDATISDSRLVTALRKMGVTVSESTIRRWRLAHGIS